MIKKNVKCGKKKKKFMEQSGEHILFLQRPQATMVRNHVEIERPKPPPYPQNNMSMKKFRIIDGRLFICYLFIKNFNETVSLTTQKI